ncbi:hypothetical protein PBI_BUZZLYSEYEAR_44 [Mycobacterium phage BuzzLyseyear]|nr:hypothetical protein PBI_BUZZLYSEYEAR_44 [Mycobacterium phage BuzzLyseyear]AIM50166.1 hypothetical protein PBI_BUZZLYSEYEAR_44 [Mycobacterium phage BuzzLyseyear]
MDPAIEAAKRLADSLPSRPQLGRDQSEIDQAIADLVIAAAREMAKPIRELSQELRAQHLTQNDLSDQARERYLGVEYVLEKLAPLIFSSEELR